VWGLVSPVWGLISPVWGLIYPVWGLIFPVWGLSYQVLKFSALWSLFKPWQIYDSNQAYSIPLSFNRWFNFSGILVGILDKTFGKIHTARLITSAVGTHSWFRWILWPNRAKVWSRFYYPGKYQILKPNEKSWSRDPVVRPKLTYPNPCPGLFKIFYSGRSPFKSISTRSLTAAGWKYRHAADITKIAPLSFALAIKRQMIRYGIMIQSATIFWTLIIILRS
jgi:hypothetical protein